MRKLLEAAIFWLTQALHNHTCPADQRFAGEAQDESCDCGLRETVEGMRKLLDDAYKDVGFAPVSAYKPGVEIREVGQGRDGEVASNVQLGFRYMTAEREKAIFTWALEHPGTQFAEAVVDALHDLSLYRRALDLAIGPADPEMLLMVRGAWLGRAAREEAGGEG